MDTTFKGAAKRITDIDIPRIGAIIGVGEDEMHAFMDVEAAGSGFDSKGRPKMLFEPHVFYRNLSGAKRTAAVKAGLAYAKWGAKPYPRDSYPRLIKAMKIDETAALKSCSWGMAQVLGENHKAAGYQTVQAMVEAMKEDEASHLEAAVGFIKTNKLDGHLRNHHWAVFARGYNGSGYKKNRYDTRLAKAFAKWSKIRDTPWPGGASAKPKPVAADLTVKQVNSVMKLGSKGEYVKALQENLNKLGYGPIETDGVFGKDTEEIVESFQKDAKLELVDGWAGPATVGAISKELEKRKTAPKIAAAEKVVDDAASGGSFSKTEVITTITGVTGTATVVKEGVDAVRESTSSFMDLASTVGPWVLLAVVLASGAAYIVYDRRRKRIEAQAVKKVL